MHAGPDDRCNQELLSEVPASQPDLSPALKPLVGSTPLPASSWSGTGSLIRLKQTLELTLYPSSLRDPEFLCPKKKHLVALGALI